MAAKEQSVSVKIEVPSKNLPGAQAVNWAYFTHVNTDVQMLLGYVDAGEVHRVIERVKSGRGGDVTLSPEVTHRVALSVAGFANLHKQVNEIYDKMAARGIYKREENAG